MPPSQVPLWSTPAKRWPGEQQPQAQGSGWLIRARACPERYGPLRPSPGHLSPTGEAGDPGSRQGRAWQAACYPPSLRYRPCEGHLLRLFPVLEGQDFRPETTEREFKPSASSKLQTSTPSGPQMAEMWTQASPGSLSREPGIRAGKPGGPAFTAGHSLLGGTQRKGLPLQGPGSSACPQPLRSLGFLTCQMGIRTMVLVFY